MKQHKRRIFSVALILCMVISLCILPASALDSNSEISTETIYFEDGSYEVVSLEVYPTNARASTKSASKVAKRYNSSGVLQCTFTLNGTFSYTGSSATATSSSTSYSISNSAWSCTSRSSSCSGNSVTGTATFKNLWVTYSPSLKITCSATGTIS